MTSIRATQIKMARAYLGWSQEELAQATGIAVSTIRKLETGYVPRGRTTETICRAIEKAGLEFIEPEGVRRRATEVEVISGADSTDIFVESMFRDAKAQDGDILALIKSRSVITDMLSPSRMKPYPNKLVRCLLPEEERTEGKMPFLSVRYIRKDRLGPLSLFIYGKKHAVIMPDSENAQFVIFHSVDLSFSYRAHFLALWDEAEKQ